MTSKWQEIAERALAEAELWKLQAQRERFRAETPEALSVSAGTIPMPLESDKTTLIDEINALNYLADRQAKTIVELRNKLHKQTKTIELLESCTVEK